MTRFAAFLIIFCGMLPAAAAAQDRVTVFAAASLRGVLEDIAESHPEDIALSFGGSGTMARQVAAGAPADVLVLASADWVDWVLNRGILPAAAPVAAAANTLVLIGPAGSAPLQGLDDLPARLADGRLAMGHREAVPAGVYARQWLEREGVWDRVSGRLAETDNVRAALAFVARGAAPFGIVYATDAAAEPGVDILLAAPAKAHDPILYTAIALTDAGIPFVARLTGAPGAAAFAAHGFTPVSAE